MKFDDNDMVILGSINATEATAYICFLYAERARHGVEAERTRMVQLYRVTSNDFTEAWRELWRSEERRHLKDIEMIDEKIQEVRERFNLEEK